jgi:hypothetical protein
LEAVLNQSFANSRKMLSLYAEHVLDSARAVAATSNFNDYALKLEHAKNIADLTLSRTSSASVSSVDAFLACRGAMGSMEQAFVDWKDAFADRVQPVILPQAYGDEIAVGRALDSIKVSIICV